MINYLAKIKSILKGRTLPDIVRWTRPVHAMLLWLSVLNVVSSLLSLGVTLVTRELIDGAVSANANALTRYGVMLAALIIVMRVLDVLYSGLRSRASVRLQREMQRMITQAVLSREYASLKSYHSGDLINRIFSDAEVVKNGVINTLAGIINTLVSFIGAAIILISMDWRFVPVLILGGLIGVVITLLFRNPMKRRHTRMQEAESALRAGTQETLESLRVVKASLSEARVMRQLEDSRERLSLEQLRNARLSIAMNNGMGVLFDVSWLVCNLWGCVKIYRGEFTYGGLAAMIQLIGRIQAPIASAVQMASQIYGVLASAERLQEVIGLPEEPNTGKISSFDRIALENVSFQYEDGTDEVLLNVTASIRRGDFIALTGRSGGGKTSLFHLLLGLYRPTHGAVVFESGAERILAGRGTRALFAYVPQGNTLFSGTLRENLTRFTDSASDTEVIAAAKAACIDDLVAEIGLDAVLGEHGVGLSEGQAQRVAVARALLSRAPILLLDEATSALDEATEANMLTNIGRMRDKTVLIVTHRRAALDICDVRWHIEEGRMSVTRLARHSDDGGSM